MDGYRYFYRAPKINTIYYYVNRKGALNRVKYLELRVCFTENPHQVIVI